MLEFTQTQQQFSVPADQEPTAVTLDPNTWVLMDARFSRR
jgi:hypothetical protein